jgi:hypothetical protein
LNEARAESASFLIGQLEYVLSLDLLLEEWEVKLPQPEGQSRVDRWPDPGGTQIELMSAVTKSLAMDPPADTLAGFDQQH